MEPLGHVREAGSAKIRANILKIVHIPPIIRQKTIRNVSEAVFATDFGIEIYKECTVNISLFLIMRKIICGILNLCGECHGLVKIQQNREVDFFKNMFYNIFFIFAVIKIIFNFEPTIKPFTKTTQTDSIMKYIKIILITLMCLFAQAIVLEASDISVDEALQIAKREVQGEEAINYYLVLEEDDSTWTIFADCHPMQNWSHEAYILRIPKNIPEKDRVHYVPIKESQRFMPSKELILLEGTQSNCVEFLRPANIPLYSGNQTDSSVSVPEAQRTYAIILSGGYNLWNNHPRYWNDCAFIYKTLIQYYKISKDRVFPLMSDGNDPGNDTYYMAPLLFGADYMTSQVPCSQDLDLDGDSEADIELAATKGNITELLSYLCSTMSPNDQLFIYVIDHGGLLPNGESTICLWDEEEISQSELANLLQPLLDKSINITAVFGQCFSGGFVNALNNIGCVAVSASSADESSYAMSNLQYDEFVYWWTSALIETNPLATTEETKKIHSDLNNDGYVSMGEAFEYARSQDAQDETPQYSSNPTHWGEHVSINYTPQTTSPLVIGDTSNDKGFEPGLEDTIICNSPDIWVNQTGASSTQHENIVMGSENIYIMTRIKNIGKTDYSGGNFLHLNWALPSTDTPTKVWSGTENAMSTLLKTGGKVTTVPIPPIAAGQEIVIETTWPGLSIPEAKAYNDYFGVSETKGLAGERFLVPLNILAHIETSENGSPDIRLADHYPVKSDHSVAMKSEVLINAHMDKRTVPILVRNSSTKSVEYMLELIIEGASGASLLNVADIELVLSDELYDSWIQAGSQGSGIEPSSSKKILLTAADARLSGITLSPNQKEQIKLKVSFKNHSRKGRSYNAHLLQKDYGGNLIGSQSFKIFPPVLDSGVIIIGAQKNKGGYSLSVEGTDSRSTVYWFDQEGEPISNDNSVTVNPQTRRSTYSCNVITNEGTILTDSVDIVKDYGFESVRYDRITNVIEIYFSEELPTESSIKVSIASIDNTSQSILQDVESLESPIRISVDGISSPNIVVSLIVDGEVTDSVKLNK